MKLSRFLSWIVNGALEERYTHHGVISGGSSRSSRVLIVISLVRCAAETELCNVRASAAGFQHICQVCWRCCTIMMNLGVITGGVNKATFHGGSCHGLTASPTIKSLGPLTAGFHSRRDFTLSLKSASNMTSVVDTSPFSSLGFETLTPLLYYSAGNSRSVTNASPIVPSPDTPKATSDSIRYDLVMIWGWMNAAPRHLVKFIQLHRSLQPGVTIVFIRSTSASWFGYTNSLRLSQPLVFDLVKALPENPKIFVHTFSNGGTSAFADFLAHYRYEVGSPMPLSAMIIDSAPGGAKLPSALTRGVNAFMEVVENNILKAVLYPIVYLLVCVIYLPPAVIGMEDPISRMRRTLNDETLVSEGGVRGYTYCKGDIMVGWEDIIDHAEEAKERGWKVLKLGFDGGSHVGCYRYHPREYEEFVRQIRTYSSDTS